MTPTTTETPSDPFYLATSLKRILDDGCMDEGYLKFLMAELGKGEVDDEPLPFSKIIEILGNDKQILYLIALNDGVYELFRGYKPEVVELMGKMELLWDEYQLNLKTITLAKYQALADNFELGQFSIQKRLIKLFVEFVAKG